jgi:hypothetical protein
VPVAAAQSALSLGGSVGRAERQSEMEMQRVLGFSNLMGWRASGHARATTGEVSSEASTREPRGVGPCVWSAMTFPIQNRKLWTVKTTSKIRLKHQFSSACNS